MTSGELLRAFDWKWAGYWTLAFLANLPVPIAGIVTYVVESARPGVFSGCLVVYWVGLILCGCRFRVGRSLALGGALLIPFQFLPIPQVLFAMIADGMWSSAAGNSIISIHGFVDTGAFGPESSLAGFFVVLFSAWWMCVMAVWLGTVARWVHRDHPLWRNRPAHTDPDADS